MINEERKEETGTYQLRMKGRGEGRGGQVGKKIRKKKKKRLKKKRIQSFVSAKAANICRIRGRKEFPKKENQGEEEKRPRHMEKNREARWAA